MFLTDFIEGVIMICFLSNWRDRFGQCFKITTGIFLGTNVDNIFSKLIKK